jgi:membrane protein DedA with SNARE-associated domain
MVVGQIAFVLTCFYLGEAASSWVDRLIQFFRERLWQSTAIFASLVLLQQLAAYRRRQRRKTEPPV